MGTDSFVLLLEKAQQGDRVASQAVYRRAFLRLRGIASALLRRERPDHTLQPTALVSELFLKLQRTDMGILGEDHFYRISARAMGQVLIDHARVRRIKQKIPLEAIPELLSEVEGHADLESRLAVKGVFKRLQSIDGLAASTIWLRYVEGQTVAEIAKQQGREGWRVRADCDFGLEWMAGQLASRR